MRKDYQKILVVDDDNYNYILIKEILNKYKIEFSYASCGSEAIEFCIKDKQIDLILMDIKMKGMNGFETALHIKGFRKDIPILFQTAFAKEFNKDELMKSIGNGYIEKPIKRDVLINEISKHIVLVITNNTETNQDANQKGKSFFSLVIANLF